MIVTVASMSFPERLAEESAKPSNSLLGALREEEILTMIRNHVHLPEPIRDFLRHSKEIVMFKPPVGFVALFVALRLIYTGRIFRVYRKGSATTISVDGMLQESETRQQQRRRRRRLPVMYLDKDDRSYDSFGGVEHVRRKLCSAALYDFEPEDVQSNHHKVVAPLALDALSVTHNPGAPLSVFVEEVLEPLSKLETALAADIKSTFQSSTNQASSPRSLWSAPETEMDAVIQMSAKTVEVRALDALLRLTRDRLLVTSSRLARTVRHWERRVKMQRTLGRFLLARFRLGAVQRLLMERPHDIDDKTILRVLARTSAEMAHHKTVHSKPFTNPAARKSRPTQWSRIRDRLPDLSKYSLRWNAEGRGRLQIRVSDDYKSISSDAAWDALFRDNSGESPREWTEKAHVWTVKARDVLCGIIRQSLETSDFLDARDISGEMANVEEWCIYDYNGNDVAVQWTTMLNLIDNWDKHGRMGEGRALMSGLGVWPSRLDIFGIPSALAIVGIANIVHIRLSPYWPKFKYMSLELMEMAWRVFRKRVWAPFYGIVSGLVSKKSDSLLDAFDVNNEEQSLDNMLRDLGLGDGTPASRRAAIQGAARAYENEMDSGVLKSAFRGRLVRLLLVQVQQLKAGLLHALASIDVLVAANKLNLQILAAIPSVLLVVFGTRFFLRALFTVRSKDLRSLHDVHTEMSIYLDEMEKSLIMTSRNPRGGETPASDLSSENSRALGEFVLNMRSYLVLLDYCSPPFPSRSCDAIQKSMQELLTLHASTDVMGIDPQVALLHLLRHKHGELLKYL